jgi:bifunctional DNase/RNase
MLRMIIEGVGFDHHKQTVVVLKDSENQKLLPIWIGPSEAKAIALELEGARPSRPLSHDLLLAAIHLAQGSVTQVVINDLIDKTFYATIDIQTPQGELHIDARPSDAIAVAVRAKCPVFVDGGAEAELIEMSQVSNGEDSEDSEDAFPAGSTPDPSSAEEIERFKRLLGELGD